MNIKKMFSVILIWLFASHALASVTCTGKITEVVKWSDSEDLSILIENTGRYIKFNDKTAISMASMAFAAQKTVTVHMGQDSITSCSEGWAHYTVHNGYFKVVN
jgi:hypothetical protein